MSQTDQTGEQPVEAKSEIPNAVLEAAKEALLSSDTNDVEVPKEETEVAGACFGMKVDGNRFGFCLDGQSSRYPRNRYEQDTYRRRDGRDQYRQSYGDPSCLGRKLDQLSDQQYKKVLNACDGLPGIMISNSEGKSCGVNPPRLTKDAVCSMIGR